MFISGQLDDTLPGRDPGQWATDTVAGPDAPPVDWTRSERRMSLPVRIGALALVIGIYSFYRQLRVGVGRDVFSRGLPLEPFRHALTVLKVEHGLGLDFEHGLQHLFLGYGIVIRFANGYYSWAHQAMTLALVAAVLLKAPWHRAKQWVGALLLQLPVGLLMFRLYPLMPPRLLDAGAPWGGRILSMHRELRPTGIVDTLVKVRGPWSPAPVPLDSFTNQFAAMPSLHCGFALWVGVVWWQWAKGKSWRFVGPLHTAVIFFCVVVTGNHYVLDAIVGWAIALVMLGVTGRFVGARRWLRSYGEQGDNSLMPSIESISQ